MQNFLLPSDVLLKHVAIKYYKNNKWTLDEQQWF